MINFPGPDKILLLMVIALVVLGPTRLPGAARTVGKWIGELRKLSHRFQEEMGGALADPKDALTSAVGDLHKEVGAFRSDIAGFGRSMTTVPDTTIPNLGEAGPTTWATASNGSIVSPSEASYASSTVGAESVSRGPAEPGLPPLPPTPDDPSLN